MKFLLLVLLILAVARGEDLTTTDGKTYKGVTIRKVEPDGLAIMHEAGMAKVPFTKLSPEIQQKHGYDPKKAAAYAKEQDAAQRAAEAAIDKGLAKQAKNKAPASTPAVRPGTNKEPGKAARLDLGRKTKKQEIGARVLQVLPEGILFSGGGRPWLLVDHPQQGTLADGNFVKCYAVKTEATFKYTDTLGAERTVRVWQWAGRRLGR